LGDARHVMLTRENAQEMRDDGLEIIESYYIIPEWAFTYRLERVVMFLQDVFYFRNPFRS
jgi:hypothetical protein